MKSSDRLWSLGAGLVAVGVAIGVWFGAISPDLRAASSARESIEAVTQQNAIHETRIEALERSADRMPEFQATRDELARGIPSDLAYSDFIRQLDSFATEAGISLESISSIDAISYTPPIADVATAPVVEDVATGETTTSDEAAAAAPADGSGVDEAPMPYTDPLITEQNVAAVQFTVVAEGRAEQLRDFLQRLQMGTRLVSVSAASITTETDAESGKAEIVGYLYVLQPGGISP